MTRISAKLFRDFEPGGGLCYILVAAIKYKLARPDFSFDRDLAKADRAAVSTVSHRPSPPVTPVAPVALAARHHGLFRAARAARAAAAHRRECASSSRRRGSA